jgi:hypothetical protein
MTILDDLGSFDIRGTLVDGELRTAFRGYVASLRIGNDQESIENALPITVSGIVFSVFWRYISENAALISFKLESARNLSARADIHVFADVHFDDLDNAPIAGIRPQRGFSIVSPTKKCTFILKDYPLVTDVSAYWFGFLWNYTGHEWAQVGVDSVSGSDTALAFSWQGLELPANGTVVKTFAVRFGDFESSHITLVVTWPNLPNGAVAGDPIALRGRASASVRPTGVRLKIYFVIDGDEDAMEQIQSAEIDTEFAWQFVPKEIGIENGTHTFSLYAIDEDGDISPPQTLTVLVKRVADETPTANANANVGAIVGGVVGWIAVIAACAGVIVYFGRRRKPGVEPLDSTEIETNNL